MSSSLTRTALAAAALAGARARALAPATLYVVSTPVGNLRDITLRALDVLGACDAILCEDSRATRRLLTAHGLVPAGDGEFDDASWDEAVPAAAAAAAAAPRLLIGGAKPEAALARLRLGQSLALVSDAGTPCLSDPGARIVAAARSGGFKVCAVPGASAALAALAVSGWDVHAHYSSGRSGAGERAAAARKRRRAAAAGFGAPLEPAAMGPDAVISSPGFVFLGFLPPKGSARRAQVSSIASEPGTCTRTVLLFEAGARLARTLRDIDAAAQPGLPRAVLVCRELTKLHEESRRFASLAEAAEALEADGAELRGEFTILVSPALAAATA